MQRGGSTLHRTDFSQARIWKMDLMMQIARRCESNDAAEEPEGAAE